MFGLTPLGTLHTAVSLVAVAAGLWCFWRYKLISLRNPAGQVYVATTVIVCLTGFGIFQHGGFGKPHVLGILTLVVLVVAAVAGHGGLFGRASRYVETIAYTTTFLFHMIPALTETFTRLPVGSPWFAGPDDPMLQKVTGAFVLIYVAGLALQIAHLRSNLDAPAWRRARIG